MATTVSVFNVTINASGVLSLSGPGLYNVTITGASPDEVVQITGIGPYEMFDLRPANASNFFILRNNEANGIFLQEGLDFETVNARDKITLRGSATGVEEEYRRRIPGT